MAGYSGNSPSLPATWRQPEAVKVCAVDEVWSGLKFVIRVKDRLSASMRKT